MRCPLCVCFPDSHGVGRKRDYSPVSWSEYFEMMDDVVVGSGENKDISFLKSGLEGPILVLLHGGGHSALSWAVFTAAMTSRVTCRVLAMDLRGHGDTQVRNTDDLSAQTMSKDVANVVRAIYGEIPPSLLLVGHNMGGAIAIHTATANLIPSVVGLVVIDVVEGSATEVLHSMQNFLRGRPKTFKSIDHAIEWSVKSGQIRNLESAKVSMVGQVRRCGSVDLAQSEQLHPIYDVIAERHEEFYDLNYVTDKPDNPRTEPKTLSNYSWRIDLSKAGKHWDGWFRGISNLFLSCNVPKLLLLAGIDRLDRDLTIGQMQGKFMMQVLAHCGHAVHEDIPDKVAEALASFMIRQKFAEAKSGNKSSSYPFMR
ncbi:protein phosphatase methylesterase 1-like [Acipenser oxyrinchus oxyrinchus]|uniref:Protein phosphatase methylesterase 1 n=1 Tax=Acipenser oxyrinchus oxyrinchus TaxID=40147 RepID=A0AAD8GJN2_ACIOX|nr:protein phosphatase methylesterase 1-like [Acipenser oxyrinchus oxyrinchus]